MSDKAAQDEEIHLYTMEEENYKLRQDQVKSINTSMRKVRKLSRKSQQFARAVVVEEVQKEIEKKDTAGLYVESPGRIERLGAEASHYMDEPVEDDTGQFCIPEPTMTETVTAALSKALDQLEEERRSFSVGTSSPVIKRWKIL